ncbi:cytidine deaminase [bacterium]|nr:MAG: cytidine deaminase [bacterium]
MNTEILNKLIESGIAVWKNSYSPYSKYPVGAAVLADSGNIYNGTNVENGSYGLTICAERSAIFSAISAGERKLVAIVIVSENGAFPCGACRQVFAEFTDHSAEVIIADTTGKIIHKTTIGKILPDEFRMNQL